MRWHLAFLVLLAGCATTERNYPVARYEGLKVIYMWKAAILF